MLTTPSKRSLKRPNLLLVVVVLMLAPVSIAADDKAIEFERFYLALEQLQAANLGVSRQISETQIRAAEGLANAINGGRIVIAAEKDVVEALGANARTLAAITYAPVATQDVATGEAFTELLQRNVAIVDTAQGLAGASSELRKVLAEYAVLQFQTQELALALRNGWTRYSEMLRNAVAADLLPPEAFDATTKTWGVQTPDLSVLVVGQSFSTPEDQQQKPVEASAAGPDGTASLPQEIQNGEGSTDEDRLVPGGGLELSEIAPSTAQATDTWGIRIAAGRRTEATATDQDPANSAIITRLTIGCHPNGTLRYTFDSSEEFQKYFIFVGESGGAEVLAEGNVVAGANAIRMSDVLRLAFEEATRVAQNKGRIVIAPVGSPDNAIHLPTVGYLEARGRVLNECEPWSESDEGVDGSDLPENEGTPGPNPTTDSEAPIPYPRPQNRTPIDLMTKG